MLSRPDAQVPLPAPLVTSFVPHDLDVTEEELKESRERGVPLTAGVAFGPGVYELIGTRANYLVIVLEATPGDDQPVSVLFLARGDVEPRWLKRYAHLDAEAIAGLRAIAGSNGIKPGATLDAPQT